jgi:hypothetical protein
LDLPYGIPIRRIKSEIDMPEQVTLATARTTRRVERWFYVGAGVFLILLSVVAFGPSIIDQSRRTASLTPLVIAHGVVSGAWLLLFLTQAMFVATGRTAVHRRVGIIGFALAAVVVGYAGLTVIQFSRRGYDLSGDIFRVVLPQGSPQPSPAELAGGTLAPLLTVLEFGVLVAAALWYRHRSEVHKRLMVLALLLLAGVPLLHLGGVLVGRWPMLLGEVNVAAILISLVLPFVPAIHDRMSRGRIHPVSLWVPVLMFAWAVVTSVLTSSNAWSEFAVWLVR